MKIKSLNIYKQNLSFILFLLCLVIWLSLSIYGAFHDLNITNQEGFDMWDENFLFHGNKFLFLFSGNKFLHQHLYSFLVYLITDNLGYLLPLDYIYVGRILSIIFAFLSIITVIIFIKINIKDINSYLIASIIALHPLFFFYSIQAEPYTMLFFFATLQLLTYFGLKKNKFFTGLFFITSILGFFAHYYFIIILFAECLHELFYYVKNKKVKLSPFYAILVISIIFLFQAPEIIKTTNVFFQDGISLFSWTFMLKWLGIFWGITPVIFPDPIVYFLSITLLITTLSFIYRDINSIPKIILIYFILFLLIFVISLLMIFGWMNNFSYPAMRHYIHIVLPLTIISCISLNKYKKSGYIIIALILCTYAYTDFRTIYTKYKYDGLSVISYIHQKEKLIGQHNYLTLISPQWAAYGLVDRNISFNYVDPYWPGQIISYNTINLHSYYRHELWEFSNMPLPPLFPDRDTRVAYALRYRIYLDSNVKIEQFEDFMNQNSTNKILKKMLKIRSCTLNDYEERFLKDYRIPIYKKNRLLFEILYPQYIPNVIRRELRIEDKITDIIDAHPEISYFYLIYVNEFILGMDVLDTTIQETALHSMLNNPRLILNETIKFPNVTIYTFARKNHYLKSNT